jgi:chemotaxis protein MotB
MAGRRSSFWLAAGRGALAGAVALGSGACAHTEDEWQAKLREVADLKARVEKAEAQHGSSQRALDDEGQKLSRLERDLRAAGIDPDGITAAAEEQARAMEEHRRRAEHLEAAKKRLATLREKLAPLAADGVAVLVRRGRVVVQLPGDALFDTGRETLRPAGKEMLTRVATVIRADKALAARPFEVAGHVERGRPGGAFKDGWGLSVMRAREVLAFLVQPADKGGGLAPARGVAAGYGDVDPVDLGDSAEAKKKNRRCELVLGPTAEESLDLRELEK